MGWFEQAFIKRSHHKWLSAGVVSLILVMLTACSNHTVKRAYLQPSTDLAPLQGGSASQRDKKRTDSKSLQACSSRYKVVSGDSLSLISARCNIKLSALARANDLSPPYTIQIGQNLIIPTLNAKTIRQSSPTSNNPIHSLPSQTELKKSYQLANWRWPMEQSLDHRFIKDTAGKTGLEINAFPGMAILAVADGEVVYVGSGIMQFGLMVMLKHNTGHISVYAHNSQVFVKAGQSVKVGQRIANSGATGLTDRPKVYVEARYKGKKVDIQKMFD